MLRRLRAFVFKSRLERELDDELRFYLEKQIEQNVAAGMTPEEARYAALRSFGGVAQVKEECRDLRPSALLETLWQDLRFGARMFRKNRGATAVAILTLALGIGANTAIFSVTDAVLLRPLPVKDPDRVVRIWDSYPEHGSTFVAVAIPNFLDYKEQNRVFERIAAMQRGSYWLSGADRLQPVPVSTLRVTADLFPLLGVQAFRGRVFSPVEDGFGPPLTAVLTHGYWQRRFGGDPDILGKTLMLSGWWWGLGWTTRQFAVVGILPPDFRLPPVGAPGAVVTWDPDVLLPFAYAPVPGDRGMWSISVIARLKPNITVEQAQADLSAIAEGIKRQHAEAYPDYRVIVAPATYPLNRTYGPTLWPLLAAVGFVLLIGCVNVANLLLARGAGRARELSIRLAVGAGRGRLLRQLLTESVLLALAGGAAGVLLASWGTRLLVSLIPGKVARLDQAGMDARVLGFALGLSLLTALLFGLVPALRYSRPELLGVPAAARLRLAASRVLVVAELALALVVLIGAGLMLNSFLRLASVDPGFDVENVLAVRVSLPPVTLSKYQKAPQIQALWQELLDRAARLPGVLSAAAASSAPFRQTEGGADLTIPGRPGGEKLTCHFESVTRGYFETLRIPLLASRWISPQVGAPVAVINQAMARRFWPNEDPLGKGLYWGHQDLETGKTDPRYPPPRLLTIVGVAKDVKAVRLESEPGPVVYTIPARLLDARSITLFVRTTSDPLRLAELLRTEIQAADRKEITIDNVRTLEQLFSDKVAQPRFRTLLVGIFAALALLLACVGVYGVLSYAVQQRTGEIGVRMALGAGSGDILKMVLREGMLLAVVGIGLGAAGALAVTRFLAAQLYGVTPTDPLTFAGVAALLAAVALAACCLPARRAARVDPMEALRHE